MKNKLEEYLKMYLEVPRESKGFFCGAMKRSSIMMEEMECASVPNVEDYINHHKEEGTFQTKLFQLIDERELKDSEVYNKVKIDRRLFSKIRSNKDYHPSKETIILLGLALELNEQEIESLLESASYSLPMNTTYDLIIRFCFKEHIYDLNMINDFLYDHQCKLLNNE